MGTLASTAGGASFLLEVGVVILVLAILARVAARTGFSPIPLYLLAGLVIGAVAPPSVDADFIAIESQIAVILLLFMLGLEYTAQDVVASLQSSVGAGIADALLNFTPGFLAGLVLGWDPLPSILLGGVTYISSSSIVAKVVDDLGRLGNSETPAVLSVLVIEDLAMAPYLPLVAVLLAGGSVVRGVGLALVATALAVGALLLARRHGQGLSRRLQHPKSEVVLLTVVGLVLIAGGAAELLNVSAGVVAFLVGLSISGSLADRARELLSPLRDLLRRGLLRAVRPAGRPRGHPAGPHRGRVAVGGHGGHEAGHRLAGGAAPERRAGPLAGGHGPRCARRVLHCDRRPGRGRRRGVRSGAARGNLRPVHGGERTVLDPVLGLAAGPQPPAPTRQKRIAGRVGLTNRCQDDAGGTATCGSDESNGALRSS